MRSPLLCLVLAILSATVCAAPASEPWTAEAFTASPEAMLAAAADVEAGNHDVVMLYLDYRIRFDEHARAKRSYRVVFKVINDKGAQDWGTLSIGYRPWMEKAPRLEARVVSAGGAVHVLDPSTIADTAVGGDDAQLLTDDHIVRAPLPGLAAGAIVEEVFEMEDTTDLSAYGHVYEATLGRGVPVLRSRVEIDAPASLEVRHVVTRLPDLQTRREDRDGRTQWVFENGRIEPLDDTEAYVPGDVRQWRSISISTGRSWQSLAVAYGQLIDERIAQGPAGGPVALTAESGSGREATIERIVRELHGNIRYTGVEFGSSSIFPQPPAETLKRKFGDCKDKATLLVAMLRAAGIPAYLALLSAGSGEDVLPELPGLGVFNHAIVHVPGSPGYWIDATAEFSRALELPPADQGRRALVIAPDTTGLVTIPELDAAANTIVETRDIHLAENGPARILETTRAEGLAGVPFRANYRSEDRKALRKNLESYVKNEYDAGKLGKWEHSDPRNFDGPFTLSVEALDADAALTDFADAELHVPVLGLLGEFPRELMEETGFEDGQEEIAVSERAKRKRKLDFLLPSTFVREWRYRVHAPLGFVVREAPESRVERFGPASLTTTFSPTLRDGVLEGSFRFESGKRRWTPDEVEQFRSDLEKWKKTSNPRIALSLEGRMLLASGKIREGLAALRELGVAHPGEAVHHIQFAQALLDAGLGESAREEARVAVEMEPRSADAHHALAWISSHDLVSRLFRKGYDRKTAIAAYRKALSIEPGNAEIHADFAILLEHDENGGRYTDGAQLEDALEQYTLAGEDLQDLDARDNPLYLRFHMGRYDALLEELERLPRDDARTKLKVAALAAGSGVESALREAAKLKEGAARGKVLEEASQLLIAARRYPEAAGLLRAAAERSGSAASVLARANLIAGVQRFDLTRLDRSEPVGFVREFMATVLSRDDMDEREILSYMSPYAPRPDKRELRQGVQQLQAAIGSARNSARANGMDADVMLDLTQSLAQFKSESDGTGAWRVRMTAPGAPGQTVFVARQEGKLRLVGAGGDYSGAAWEVLHRLDAGDAASSRTLLDWIRAEIRITGGDDPLEGPVFPRIWKRGQDTTPAAVEFAALAELVDSGQGKSALARLRDLGAGSLPEAQQDLHTLLLARANLNAGDHDEVVKHATTLIGRYPESLDAFRLQVQGLRALGQYDAWEQAARARLAALPDDQEAFDSLASIAVARGDFEGANAVLMQRVEEGSASAQDLNNITWNELLAGKVTEEGLGHAQRAFLMTDGNGAALLHTLAAGFATTGRIAEAREMILKAMDIWGLDEPDGNCWYVFGVIAEQYGMLDAARAAYQRVEKPEHEWQVPGSSYQLAARQLAAIGKRAVRG